MDDLWPFKVESFIKEVEKNQVLYDEQHPSFEDESLKDKLWGDIGSKHAMNDTECKTVWKSICTRYLIALKVVTETHYIPQERILHNQHMKFMVTHLKDFILDPVDQKLIAEITEEVNHEMEQDMDDVIPINLQMVLRQLKLKKWTDTSLMNKYHSYKIPQYHRMVEGVVQIIRKAIRRREEIKRKQMQRQSG